VLVIETILHDDRPDPRGRMLDVIMLAISGGRERTARELDELFQSAGFGKTTLIETTGALRMVETTAV
jgi:C-methyltransferase